MDNQISIYLCSPFFNDEEVARVHAMEEFLENRGYKLYSPMRDGVKLSPDATSETRLEVFNENVREVCKSDLAIVIVATKDTGTSVELGMKYAQWYTKREVIRAMIAGDPDIVTNKEKILLEQEAPRIITFADNGAKLNVMLLGAVLKHCNSFEELGSYLDYIDEVGLENAKRDPNSIASNEVY